LPEYKPGKFSKSPKTWFPNVKFLELSIFNLDGVIVGVLKELHRIVGIEGDGPLKKVICE
jgi:hypothetical protein